MGESTVQLEADKMSEIHKFFSTYGSIPKKCDACGSIHIYPSYKNPQGNDYYMMECGECKATANFGIHKDGRGLFWKGEKMVVYKGNGGSSNTAPPVPDDDPIPEPEDEIPF